MGTNVVPPLPPGFKLDPVESKSSKSGQIQGLPPLPPGFKLDAAPQSKTPRSSQLGEFFSRVGSNAMAIPQAIWQTVRTPSKTAMGIIGAQGEQFSKAGEAFKRGGYSEAFGHSLAGLLPVLGPAAAQAGEELGTGEYGKAGADLLFLGGPEIGRRVFGGASPNPAVKTVLNPVEKSAMDFAERKGVPLSLGQRTGEPGLQKLERGLENFPGSAARTRNFFEGQQEKIATTGRDIAASASPVRTNAYGAGKLVQDRLTQRVVRLKAQADVLYKEVRADAEANKKSVLTGTKTTTSPILGPSGKPITTTSNVYQVFETPVDLSPVRTALRPVYEDLERSMPEARRASSPAFKAMSDVMKSGDTHMNAMDFDRFLSAVKALSRDGKSELLSSKSQGIAKQVVKAGEDAFRQAVATAGPDTMAKLTRARTMVRAYYGADDLLNSLRDEPAALFNNLVSGGDVTMNTLRELRKVAPHEVQAVGRTFLEGLVDKANKAEGGWSRSAGVFADWQRMGPETKSLLFGQQLTSDLDNFLLAAKRLTPAEGSATGARVTSLIPFGIGAEVVRQLLSGNVGAAAVTIGGGVAMEGVIPNLAARVLFSPGGARLASQAIRLPKGSPAWSAAVTALNARAVELSKQSGDTEEK